MKATVTVFFILASLQVRAAEWVINRDHSEVFFSVSYLNFSDVTGRFANFEGSAVTDDTGKIQSLDVVIKVDSLSTENRLRDNHLKAPDFLNSRIYPEITFRSDKVSTSDGKIYAVSGALTVHGKSKPLTVQFELSPAVKDSWGFENRFAKFAFVIHRNDFGLEWNKTLAENKYLVGETVNLRGSFQLQPLNALTPGNKHFIPVTAFTRGKEKLKRGEISREEFNRLYLPAISKTEAPVPAFPAVVVPKQPEPVREMFSKTAKWWIAFSTLGLLGFFAAIIVGFSAKHQLLQFFPKKYSEGGVLGNFGDLLVIGVTIIYSMAFWYVGWGH